MLSKSEIIKILNTDDNFVDEFILDAFIKNWKIEAIYEDENGVEFYDEAAFEKIKSALVPKKEEQNLYDVEVIKKEEYPEVQDEPIVESSLNDEQIIDETILPESSIVEVVQQRNDAEMQNVTLDITGQTLGVLAHSIAEKISGDISSYLKNTQWIDEAFEAGGYKKDNEVLSSKIKELLEDNTILIDRIQELEHELDSYQCILGNVYIKKN